MKISNLAQRRRRQSLRDKETRRRRLRVECLEARRVLAAPTLDFIADTTINVNGGVQTIDLNGISAGENEVQPLRVTASSDNPALIPDPIVTYTSADSTGEPQKTPIDPDTQRDSTLSFVKFLLL